MDSYKKLIGNSFIFAIGNLGSKLIAFILVPLYTYYLSTSEYGTIDLATITINMLIPIVSGSIFDAVLRFTMDQEEEHRVVLTNSLVISIMGFLISFIFYPILNYYGVMQSSLVYIYIILFIQILETIFNQYARAIGKIRIYALNGILLTFTTGIFSILFLVLFQMGVQGYFLAIIISNIISVLFLIVKTKAYKLIRKSNFNKQIAKNMLLYSVPLVPNSLTWWLVNASSRYFILYFVGVGSNGLFAVASKIPALVNIINQIFAQAWQLSAIEEYNSENKSRFYSKVFTYLSTLLFIGTSAVITILKPSFRLFFATEYYEAWLIVPFLLFGAVFSSLSGFLGTNYIAAKKTKGVFKTSVFGGIVSILLNFLFIPTIGIVGAGISSMGSFFVIFLIRYFDTKQFIKMQINWTQFFVNIFVLFIQIAVLVIGFNPMVELSIEIIIFLILLILNKNLLISVINFIKGIKK